MLRTRASRREDPLDVHVPDPILRAIGRFSKLGLSSQVVLVNDNVPPTKPRATYEDLLGRSRSPGGGDHRRATVYIATSRAAACDGEYRAGRTPTTAALDRVKKLAIYARDGVSHA